MSFDINGVTWTPESAATHAQNMLSSINAYRQSLGQSQLTASSSNALWLILLAAGGSNQDFDQELASAINSFNLSVCSEQQVLNLLPIAGTSLIPPSFTLLTLTCTALSSGAATIPSGTIASFNYNGVTVSFLVQNTTVVPASTSVDIETIANIAGPITVVPNQINSFTTSITNLQSVTNNSSSIPGTSEETPSEARQRVIQGNTFGWGLQASIRNLRSLQGINNAQVYFNFSSTLNETLTGGTVVPPRHSYIVISGESDNIANAYAQSMTAPTSGIYSQFYETLSGQFFQVYYDVATTQNIYVQVYYDNTQPVQSGYLSEIQAQVNSLQAFVSIGQTITAEFILTAFSPGFPYASIIGAAVSLDGINWYNKVIPNANEIPTFSNSNISAVGQ